MPDLVKAAVLWELNAPLRVESGIRAPAPAAGQVLVKLAYSGVCHSQVMEARGGRGVDRFLPHMLGHEGSGIVLAVGEGVTKVAAGDRVVLGWIKGSGADVPGTRYDLDGTTINAGGVTTFNDHALVSENRCVRLPDGMPMDLAVLLGCAVPTGAGLVVNTVRPAAGSTIAVIGLGGVGTSALMACGLFDCAEVIAVDVSQEKLALAGKLGATSTINAAEDEPVAAIRALTGGAGADYVVEAAGLTATIEQAFAATRRGGLCVFASHPPSGQTIAIDPYELIAGKRILGSWGGGSDPDRDVPRFAELYLAGRLPLEVLVSHRYTLEEVNVALDDLASRRASRPLIELDPALG